MVDHGHGSRTARVLWAFHFAGCLALAACGQGEAPPEETQDPGEPRIERVLVATITDTLFPGGAWAEIAHVSLLEDTTFYVLGGFNVIPDLAFFADRDGHVVHQIGRTGSGPGEFQSPFAIMSGPTSYFIVDSRLRRLTRVSKAELSVEETLSMPVTPAGMEPIMFPDESYVVAASRLRAGFGEPFHIVSSDGRVLRSFGMEAAGSRADAAGYIMTLARSGDDAFWVAHQDGLLERWGRDGRLLAAIELAPELDLPFWTPGGQYEGGLTRASPMSMHEDGDGRLWMHAYISHEVEVPTEVVGPDGEHEIIMMRRPDFSLAESVIVAIDPTDGSVIAWDRIQRNDLSGYSPGGFLQHVARETPSGYRVFDVWAARLIGEHVGGPQ